MNSSIRAVRCHRYAGIDAQGKPVSTPDPLREVLSLDEIPPPTCEDGHVLVRVNYAGVQYPDALQAQGLYQEKPPLPYVPGMDVTGVVLEMGAGVDHLDLGDRVIAQLRTGALAEVVKVPADCVWKAPDAVHLSKCANISRNYFAAYHSLKVIGETSPGDLVLVDGASGGVGMASIQLAKAMGALVIAGVSRQEKMEFPVEAGADRVLCYGRDRDSYKRFKTEVKQAAADLGHPDGVDLVIDMVQGELFEAALVSTVRPLGKLCLVGFTAGQKPIRPGILLIKQAAAVGSWWGPWAQSNPQAHQQHVREILGFMDTGAFEPRVERIFPFEDYVKAFELFEHNQGRGNTVVCVREEEG
jgi:NADPH2:quinone reductase